MHSRPVRGPQRVCSGLQRLCWTARRVRPIARHAGVVMASKRVLVPIGTGTEEMEAVIMIDVLRRAGADVTVASVESSEQVTCSRQVKLVADTTITSLANQDFDLIALPGGAGGAEALSKSKELDQLLMRQQERDSLRAAICASPAVVFEPKGLLKGHKATCHPGFVDKLSDSSAAEQRVVVDGRVTTSRGPGTAIEFSLSLVEQLYGPEKRKEVAGPMVI